MTFGEKLIKLRKRNGMSQEDLAEELGVSRQAISKWEGMLSVPDLQNVLKISELFNVTTDYLLKDGINDFGTEKASGAGEDRAVKENDSEVMVFEDDILCEKGNVAQTANHEAECGKPERHQRIAYALGYSDVVNKYFAIIAGILEMSGFVVAMLMSMGARNGQIMISLPTAVILTLTVAIGIFTILSVVNKKFLGIAFCLLLICDAVSIINLIVNAIGNAGLLVSLVSNILSLVYAILAVIRFYGKDKIKSIGLALIILPSVCAIVNAIIAIFTIDTSGKSMETLPFATGCLAEFFMAAIMFREIEHAKKSENIGLAGVTMTMLAAGLSAVHLIAGICRFTGEVSMALYIYGFAFLYIIGFIMLPWLAFYSAKKTDDPIEKKGYVGIIRHILLTCFTVFVWHWIWVYKTSSLLNKKENKTSSSVIHTVLYILLPFYYIYWFNLHGRKLSEVEKEKLGGADSVNTGMVAISIILPFVGSVLMQNRINAAAASENKTDFSEIKKSDDPN